jgi:hypothetical protein
MLWTAEFPEQVPKSLRPGCPATDQNRALLFNQIREVAVGEPQPTSHRAFADSCPMSSAIATIRGRDLDSGNGPAP